MCLKQTLNLWEENKGEYFPDFEDRKQFLKWDQIHYPKGEANVDKFDNQL